MLSRRSVLEAMAGATALAALAGCTVTKTEPTTSGSPSPTEPAPPSETPTPTPTPEPTPTLPAGLALPDGLVNVLVLGSDSRSEDLRHDSRSDVICLVQLTPDRTHLNMVSIARDTLAALPGGGRGKINEAYTRGGAPGAAAAVSGFLGGIPVHYTLETGFTRFMAIIDQLDRITVQNRIASRSAGPVFPAGEISLDGNIGLGYVRERHGLPNGDLDRTERARATLTGMMLRVGAHLRENDVAFVDALPSLWEKVIGGNGLLVEHAIGLVNVAKTLTAESVTSVLVPIARYSKVNGADVNIPNDARKNEIVAGLQVGDLTGYVAKYGMSTDPTG